MPKGRFFTPGEVQSTLAVLEVWLVSGEGFLHPWFESTPADLEVCLCLKEGFYIPGGGSFYPCCHGGLSAPQRWFSTPLKEVLSTQYNFEVAYTVHI